MEEKAHKLARTLDNSNYEPIFNSKSNLDNWAKKKGDANDEFQTNYIEQNFAAWEDAIIKKNNADILPQMIANNERKDSLILEKIIERKSNRKKEQTAKIEPILDDYLQSDASLKTLKSRREFIWTQALPYTHHC